MQTDPKVLVDRAAGAILGVFIGDALGVARLPAEIEILVRG